MDKCSFCIHDFRPLLKCEICLTNFACNYCNKRYAFYINVESVCCACLKTYIPEYIDLIEEIGGETDGTCYCSANDHSDENDICDDCLDKRILEDDPIREDLRFYLFYYMKSTAKLLNVILKDRAIKHAETEKLSEWREAYLKQILPLPEHITSHICKYLE